MKFYHSQTEPSIITMRAKTFKGPSLPFLGLAIIMTVFTGVQNLLCSEPETTWEVQIDVFSGRPNPVFKLEEAEVRRAQRFVSLAEAVPTAKDKARVFPARLGYRGCSIRQIGNDKSIHSEIRVRGRDMLEKVESTETWRTGDSTALEDYLVDLALQKGVIDETSYTIIRKAMEAARKGR